jgi:hypothetical protein
VSKAMRRATRSARAVVHGAQILQMIQQPKVRRTLVAAAESGVPPVTAISGKIPETIPARDAKLPPVRQFIGLCVRAVLEEEGFEVAEAGVRVSNDPIFRTGSTYRRMQADSKAISDLLTRFVESLTDQEASQVDSLLRKRRK